MIKLSDFQTRSNLSGGLIPDISKLEQLSKEEFREAHKNEMNDFFRFHVDCNKETPTCGECKISIGNPERLRRYFGVNLHPDCFEKVYRKERAKLLDYEKEYFDLILRRVL